MQNLHKTSGLFKSGNEILPYQPLAIRLSSLRPMSLRDCEMDGDRLEAMLICPPKFVVDADFGDEDPFADTQLAA
jgi:hypothetical protein